MTLKHDDGEQLSDYAVDVGELKKVHEAQVAKRIEIEALIAAEQGIGSVESLNEEAKERLTADVDRHLEEWEREKIEGGIAATGSAAFNKLAQEHYKLSQAILAAQDEQVREATERPFEHPLR